jgi:hypothetical protein
MTAASQTGCWITPITRIRQGGKIEFQFFHRFTGNAQALAAVVGRSDIRVFGVFLG